MRFDHAHHHLSRRDALKLGAAGATAVAATGLVGVPAAGAKRTITMMTRTASKIVA